MPQAQRLVDREPAFSRELCCQMETGAIPLYDICSDEPHDFRCPNPCRCLGPLPLQAFLYSDCLI